MARARVTMPLAASRSHGCERWGASTRESSGIPTEVRAHTGARAAAVRERPPRRLGGSRGGRGPTHSLPPEGRAPGAPRQSRPLSQPLPKPVHVHAPLRYPSSPIQLGLRRNRPGYPDGRGGSVCCAPEGAPCCIPRPNVATSLLSCPCSLTHERPRAERGIVGAGSEVRLALTVSGKPTLLHDLGARSDAESGGGEPRELTSEEAATARRGTREDRAASAPSAQPTPAATVAWRTPRQRTRGAAHAAPRSGERPWSLT